LISILIEVRSKEEAQKLKDGVAANADNIKENNNGKRELAYIDVFVQSCLKQILPQIDQETIKTDDVNDI